MAGYRWPDCPAATHEQVEGFTAAVRAALGDNLAGVYLHGSLAMGGFNPARSDIDLLIVTRELLTVPELHGLARATLRYAEQPHLFELSSLPMSALHPWQYPTLFDFHYSEDWRAKIEVLLASGTWDAELYGAAVDPDLAAHITITRRRGVCLTGQPIAEVFPDVPRDDYLDSILKDFEFARDQLAENPVYAVLNYCRIYGYVREGRIDSKAEAGAWGLTVLPEYTPLIEKAMAVYEGENPGATFERGDLESFTEAVYKRIQAHR